MLDDTIEALRALALARTDASGHFPALYARVTDRIRVEAAGGRFTDADAMGRFAGSFAEWYLRPISGRSPVPASWRASLDVAGDSDLLIVQHLLLGINAHVNHDLPQVVVELADERGGGLGAMRRDFDTINQVLAETVPEVLRDLGRVASWVNLAAARGGQWLFDFSLEAARDQAWRAAVLLEPLDPAGRAVYAAELDRLVRVVAYLITRPPRPVGWVLPLARRLEDDDPEAVTRRLLGPLG